MKTKFILAPLAALFLSGCTPSGNPIFGCGEEPQPTPEQEMKRLYAEIVTLTQNTSCSDSSACKAIAIGVKPCGGPTAYFIYNGVNVNETVLVSVIKQYNDWNKKYNQEKNLSSDCSILNPPKVDCVDGKCQEVVY